MSKYLNSEGLDTLWGIIKSTFAASLSIDDNTITLKNKNDGTLSTIELPSEMNDRVIVAEFDSKSMTARDGYYLNGMCYAKDRDTFFLGFKPSDSVSSTYNGEAIICEVDTDFNLIHKSAHVDYGKVNDLCYANGKLYVAPAYSSYSQYHYRVIELNPDSLSVTAVHYPVASASPISICYDESRAEFYLDMAIANSTDHYTYKCDSNFANAVMLADSYWIDKSNLVLQSAEFYGNKQIQLANASNPTGYIYFRTYYEGNQFYDILPALTINNSVEEPEGICTIGNDIYVGAINNTTSVRIYKLSHLCDVYKKFISMGILGVEHGGTGLSSLESGKALIGNGTNSVTLRDIYTRIEKGDLEWTNTTNEYLLTKGALAYWNGAYGSTGNSNIEVLGTISKGVWQGTKIGVAYGGTGLTASPSMLTNLGSTSAANVFQASPRPGITGTLGVGNGGTGQTSAKNASNAFINALDAETTALQDGDYFIAQTAGGGTTTTTYKRKPMSSLATYVEGKIGGNYLPLAGGKMTGNIAWDSASALSRNTEPLYLLSIDAFNSGGATHYSNMLDVATGLKDYVVAKHSSLISIPSSSDLDNYSSAGIYRAATNAIATTITNAPTSKAFTLLVMPTTAYGCVQFVSEFTVEKHSFWQRSKYNDDWGSWMEYTPSSSKVRYIFPPNWNDTTSGLAVLVISPTGKVMMIDSHNASISSTMVSWVQSYVSHIDVFVLTHYHADHYGGISALVSSGLLDANSKVYLPANTSTVTSKYTSVRTEIINTLGSIPYVVASVGATALSDENFTATLLNCSSSMTYSDYNNQSTCVLCKIGDQKTLITGDAFSDPLYDIKDSVGKLSLITMGHHSINAGSSTKTMIALQSFEPTYAVQPSTMTGSAGNQYHNSQHSAIFQGIGTQIYPVHTNTTSIEIDSSDRDTWVVSGVPVASVSSQRTKVVLYVNGTVDADAIQDGTSSKPYKSVQQALGACDFHAHADYEIRIASGTYGKEHETPGKNTLTIFDGTVAFAPISSSDTVILYNGMSLLDSHVRIKNITLKTETEAEGLIVARSTDLYLDNVILDCENVAYQDGDEEDSDDDVSVDNYVGIYAYRQSEVFLNNCTVKNSYYGVVLNASNCHSLSTNFIDCTRGWSAAIGSCLYDYNTIYTNVTTEKSIRPGSHYFNTKDEENLIGNIDIINSVFKLKSLVNITATTTTTNGVAFTINDDNTISVKGTPTTDFKFKIGSVSITSGTKYIVAGCPSGGGSSTYQLYFDGSATASIDYGSGAIYTASNTTNQNFSIYIRTTSGTVDLLFRPIVVAM